MRFVALYLLLSLVMLVVGLEMAGLLRKDLDRVAVVLLSYLVMIDVHDRWRT